MAPRLLDDPALGGPELPPFAGRTELEVEGESDVVVPAGTFHSFSIRGLGGGAYAKLYYSDQAGYWSKKETYNAQDQKTSEMDLRSYHYQWTTTFLLIVVGLIALAAIAVAVLVTVRRRRRARGPPGTYPPQPPPETPPPP